VAEAITGSMDMDLVLEVASGLGALPSRTVTVEIEPAITAPSTTLSREVDGALDELVAAVRDEIQRLSSPA